MANSPIPPLIGPQSIKSNHSVNTSTHPDKTGGDDDSEENQELYMLSFNSDDTNEFDDAEEVDNEEGNNKSKEDIKKDGGYKLSISEEGDTISNDFLSSGINNKFQQEEIIRLSSIFEYHTNNIQPILCEEYINDFDLKSSQKSVYKINREHMIIQYGRMLPVNKKDIVTISVYPFNEQISIYKYDISKNKKYNIECYMACLNIT